MTDTPFNREAEQSVLGALLLENNAIDRIGDLRVDHFYSADHRIIFAEIKRQIVAGQSCDVISVFDSLRDKVSDCIQYLNQLAQNTPSSANISRYAFMVRDTALRRGLIAETSRIAEMAMRPNGKTSVEVLDAAQSAISALAEITSSRDPIRASDAMLAHVDVMEGRMDRKLSGIPTGFAQLDEILTGGMNRGALIILGARPSMGKTALSLNIAANCARDYCVLFLSQEMSNGELLDRTIAQLGKIPLGSIIRGDMTGDEWSKFTAANSKLHAMNLHIDDQPALTILDVRAKAQLVKRKHGLDVLVVDYLQLMSGDGDSRNQQIEEISRGLKSLAKELQIAVIALSQLSRNAANQSRPKLSDLRDSGAIEQDADIVLFLHRDEVDNPKSHMQGIADLFVAKNRQGRIDDVMLGYEGMYTLFKDHYGHRPEAPKAQANDYRKGAARNL